MPRKHAAWSGQLDASRFISVPNAGEHFGGGNTVSDTNEDVGITGSHVLVVHLTLLTR